MYVFEAIPLNIHNMCFHRCMLMSSASNTCKPFSEQCNTTERQWTTKVFMMQSYSNIFHCSIPSLLSTHSPQISPLWYLSEYCDFGAHHQIGHYPRFQGCSDIGMTCAQFINMNYLDSRDSVTKVTKTSHQPRSWSWASLVLVEGMPPPDLISPSKLDPGPFLVSTILPFVWFF